jgi:hypothetical protein
VVVVRRRLALLALAFLVEQSVAAPALRGVTECREGCDDDGPNGRCGSTCEDCSCCARLGAFAVAEPAALVRLVQERAARRCPSVAPSSPDGADIFHVPKPALA